MDQPGQFPGPNPAGPQYDPRFLAAMMSAATMLAFERQIIAPSSNPFALEWVPAGSMTSAGIRIGETREVNGRQDVTHIGDGSLHPGDTNGADLRPAWHHVIMEPRGEVFFDPTTEEIPSADASLTFGNTATVLKARIEFTIGNARKQAIDFDILAGVDFSLTGLHVLSIQALVPLPSSIPAVIPPDVIARSVATVISTGVYCGLPPRGTRMPLSYSQLFFLTGAEAGIMPVVPAAREVEVFADESQLAAGGLVLEFLQILDNPIVPSLTPLAPGTFFVVGQVTLAPTASHTPRVVIPGQANAMRVSRTFGSDDSTINVVQLLKF